VSSSRETEPHTKYCCPNTCIGPEFIVRATEPSKVIHVKGVKVCVTYLETLIRLYWNCVGYITFIPMLVVVVSGEKSSYSIRR
jgi:hypothetical protein